MAKGVLFDLDGVLVDSVSLHVRAYESVFVEAGIAFTDEARAAVRCGKPRAFVIEAALGRDRPELAQRLYQAKGVALSAILETGPDIAMPGTLDTIRRLRSLGTRLAVVTNSVSPEIWLRAMGIDDAIDAVVTGRDVPAPKPDPSGYSLAVRRLGLTSEQCVAIEDSEDGWLAARRAGVSAIVIADARPAWVDAETPVVERLEPGVVASFCCDRSRFNPESLPPLRGGKVE